MPIWAVKCVAGREHLLADKIIARKRRMNLDIHAIVIPAEIKGIIFVEADSLDDVYRATYGDRNYRGIIKEEIPVQELERILGKVEVPLDVEIGDIVELTSGPFKGERAKVIRVDKSKREITIELLDAAIPVQITIKADDAKVVQRKGE